VLQTRDLHLGVIDAPKLPFHQPIARHPSVNFRFYDILCIPRFTRWRPSVRVGVKGLVGYWPQGNAGRCTGRGACRSEQPTILSLLPRKRTLSPRYGSSNSERLPNPRLNEPRNFCVKKCVRGTHVLRIYRL
jgi:hypothetical protein